MNVLNFFTANPEVQEIVKLVGRLSSSTRPEDKRTTLKDLKAYSFSHQAQLGEHGLFVIAEQLKTEKDDVEILTASVDLLLDLLSRPPVAETHQQLPPEDDPNASQIAPPWEVNMRAFVQDREALMSLFDLLSESYMYLRYNTIRLLTMLLMNRNDQVQAAFLTNADNIHRVCEILADQREVIRNEILLLLEGLTHENEDIQKIVAFSETFQKLFDIIEEEGGVEGGIIVHDCLRIISNMVRENKSNQVYFCEVECMKRYPALLRLTDLGKLKDEMTIISMSVDILSHIIDGSGSDPKTEKRMKNEIGNSQVLLSLLQLSASNHIPEAFSKVKRQSLRMCAKAISNHPPNKNLLIQSNLSSSLGQLPALVYILFVALDCMDPIESSLAENIIEQYFQSNKDGQLFIASTFTPLPTAVQSEVKVDRKYENHPSATTSTTSTTSTTAAQSRHPLPSQPFNVGSDSQHLPTTNGQSFGRVLVDALSVWEKNKTGFGDPLRFWTAARILSYILRDNNDCKLMALKLNLEVPNESRSAPLYLSDICMRSLVATTRSHTDQRIQVALLLLMCTWFYECPKAIRMIFRSPAGYFPHVIRLAAKGPESVHVRGLATFIVALCLEFSRDLSLPPSALSMSSPSKGSFKSSLLLDVISNQIGLESYKHNLEQLGRCPEFNAPTEERHRQESDRQEQHFQIHFYDDYFRAMFHRIMKSVDKHILEIFAAASKTQSLSGVGPPSSTSGSAAAVAASREVDHLRSQMQHQEAELQQLRQLKKQFSLKMNELKGQNIELNEQIKIVKSQQLKQKELQKTQISPPSSTSSSSSLIEQQQLKGQYDATVKQFNQQMMDLQQNHAIQRKKDREQFLLITQRLKFVNEKLSASQRQCSQLDLQIQNLTTELEQKGIELQQTKTALEEEIRKNESISSSEAISSEFASSSQTAAFDELKTQHKLLKEDHEDLLILLGTQEVEKDDMLKEIQKLKKLLKQYSSHSSPFAKTDQPQNNSSANSHHSHSRGGTEFHLKTPQKRSIDHGMHYQQHDDRGVNHSHQNRETSTALPLPLPPPRHPSPSPTASAVVDDSIDGVPFSASSGYDFT